MTRQQKRIVLYGVLLSAVHFAVVGFCHATPELLMRPEDMIDSPNAKPSWPPYPLAEAAERVGRVLSIPFTRIWDGGMHAPDSVILLLIVLRSFLWGFGLVLVFGFLFTHLRPRHANAA
jgi:hypothetical protein